MDAMRPLDDAEVRLAAEGWRLPAPPVPRGSYAPYHEVALAGATLVHISGQASRLDGVPIVGVCRQGADLEPARQACAQAALSALAALRLACGGDLGRVRAVPQLRGYLRTDADFGEHSAVLDGASQVLQAAFPEMPRPARTAVGVSSLPSGCWAEVELSALVDKPA
ncbi:RidA family protein [Achromobacter spanius]|uniref:RidA family protein n=1 Tax=Achromobacter spanius TaxID=217203 RepID=UPI00381B72F8